MFSMRSRQPSTKAGDISRMKPAQATMSTSMARSVFSSSASKPARDPKLL